MADGVFNIAKGRVNEFINRVNDQDPTNCELVVVLLQVTESDALLEDYDNLSLLLAGANTEANFTNYARVELIETDVVSPTPDDTNDRQDGDMADPVWTSAGGASNNDLVKLIVCFDDTTVSGDDTDLIPLTFHDFVITTNGSNLTGQVNAAGFFRAT